MVLIFCFYSHLRLCSVKITDFGQQGSIASAEDWEVWPKKVYPTKKKKNTGMKP